MNVMTMSSSDTAELLSRTNSVAGRRIATGMLWPSHPKGCMLLIGLERKKWECKVLCGLPCALVMDHPRDSPDHAPLMRIASDKEEASQRSAFSWFASVAGVQRCTLQRKKVASHLAISVLHLSIQGLHSLRCTPPRSASEIAAHTLQPFEYF